MDIQFFGGRGGASGKRQNKATTPSGVTLEQFRAMSDDDKYNFVSGVIENPDIVVPDYLDKSITSKLMYAMGMTDKPQVVSDVELDKMKGEDLFRSVHDLRTSPLSAMDILDQFKYSDYTPLSGDGDSTYGRAIYFTVNTQRAIDFSGRNPIMMRAKINPNAKIVNEHDLALETVKSSWLRKVPGMTTIDNISIAALANGVDGWRHSGALFGDTVMIINRGALTMSSTTKIGEFDPNMYTSWKDIPRKS